MQNNIWERLNKIKDYVDTFDKGATISLGKLMAYRTELQSDYTAINNTRANGVEPMQYLATNERLTTRITDMIDLYQSSIEAQGGAYNGYVAPQPGPETQPYSPS